MNQTPPDSAADYIQKVLHLYRDLPETALRVSFHDQNLAREFQLRGIPLELIESAPLLGSLRRCYGRQDRLIPHSLSGLLPASHRRTALESFLGQLSGLPALQNEAFYG